MFGLFSSKEERKNKLLVKGLAAMAGGSLTEAENCFLNVIELDVLNAAEAWNNLGCLYFMTGSYKKAKDCFETAIGQNPDYYHAIRGMALLEKKLGNDERAVELFGQLRDKFNYKPDEDPTLTDADRDWFVNNNF